jgi:hypothetical protein
MKLDPDFSEFIECCVRHDVRFLVVGPGDTHGRPTGIRASRKISFVAR